MIESKDVRQLLLESDDTSGEVITLFISIVESQIALECKEETMPTRFKKVGAMAVVSLCNQRGREGLKSEKEGENTVEILLDILSPYRPQFKAYLDSKGGSTESVVKFL